MKRCLTLTVLVGLAAAGMARFHLVAQEPTDRERGAGVEQEKRVADFAAKLHVEDSELLRRFQAALKTRPGQIVMQDRIAGSEEAVEAKARAEAIPGFLAERFAEVDGKYQIRPEHKAFRDDVLRATKAFNDDVDKILPIAREIGGKIDGRNDLEKLVARFLKHDTAPVMLYVVELRRVLRPDESVIRERLGELFVANDQGQYVIRRAARAEAQEHLERGQQALRGMKRLKAELKEWSKEFATPDELHRRLKAALADPLFAAVVAARVFEDEEERPAHDAFEHFFEWLEDVTKDTGDGLVLREDREGVVDTLHHYRRVQSFARTFRQPIAAFANKVLAEGELGKGWRILLQSDLALARLAGEFELFDLDPAKAFRGLLGEILDEGDDGKYRLAAEEPEEIEEFIGHLFRRYREVRRKGRVIDEIAERLSDKELGEALSSFGGKFIMFQAIERSVARHRVDGLDIWVKEHFEEADGRVVFKPGVEEVVRDFLQQVEAVKKELAKDDF